MSVIVAFALGLNLPIEIQKWHDSNCPILWFRGGTRILLPCGTIRLILVLIAPVLCFLVGLGQIPSLPFPTLNGRSVLGIYQKFLVRGAISRTELLNISFATTCFEPFLGLLCLLVLIELENFLVRPFLSSFRKVRLCSGSNLRSGRAPPSITLGGGIIPFSSPTWVSECL